MNSQWIGSVPMIAFSIFAGALSDVFGRKPLLLFPLVGYFLGSLICIINYSFRPRFEPVSIIKVNYKESWEINWK
jgi:MFS family permease